MFKQKTTSNPNIKHPALTIPNILGYIRILLIPIFMIIYLNATEMWHYYLASGLVALSGITDFFDGFIARKFDQITELGKFIDPLADKLTQLGLIICFVIRYPLMWLMVGIYVVKEGFMAIFGLIMLKKKGRKLNGAEWCGKVCTFSLFVIMIILMMFPAMLEMWVTILILVCAGMMIMSFSFYLPVYIRLWKGNQTASGGKAAP